MKSVTVMPDNPSSGRPAVQGALVLFDDRTGAVEAVIDSALVTYWKTAADSLLGARLLARPDSRRLLILGAGALAESLVSAYRAGFPGIRLRSGTGLRRGRATSPIAAGPRLRPTLPPLWASPTSWRPRR